MEEVLARARKVSGAAEVYTVSSEETPVNFEANKLKNIQSRESTITCLRLIRNGRTGYAVTTSLEDIQGLIDSAVDTSQFGMEAKFEFPDSKNFPDIKTHDPAVMFVPIEDMIKLGQDMIDRVKVNNPEVLCGAHITKARSRVRIMNSRGGRADYSVTVFRLGVEGTLVRGTDMLFVGDSESSCHPINDIEAVVKTTTRQLELAKTQAKIETKMIPVVFTPDGVASALISPLMSAFNGKTVLEGASPLGNRTNEVVFDKKLNLADDATIPYRPPSRPCDDEGVPTQRNPLIEEGRVMGFLYDLQTAALAHTRSTGSGARGRGSLPNPSASAFVMSPGKTSPDEMLADIKEGLLIEDVMGAGQGNILNGDFSGNVLLGYKIENGRVTGRVKDTMVFGNVYTLLGDIAAIGSDGKWVGSFLFTPSIFCNKLSVAAK